jgi:prolyl oligopeptidase
MVAALDNPPFTEIEPVTDILHGIEIVDPYRWLEDQKSPRTRAWLERQQQYTEQYFSSIPDRSAIRQRVVELLTPASKSAPWIAGGKYFFLERLEQGQQPAILMRKGFEGTDTVLVDPALLGVGSAVAVAISAVSVDGRFLAYAVRHGGTDHATFQFLDIEQNVTLPERLSEGYCGGIVFAVDGTGFYHCHRPLQDPRPDYRAVFWHQFGTEHSADREVFCAGESANLFLTIRPSADVRQLLYVLFYSGRDPRVSVYIHHLPDTRPPRLVIKDMEGRFTPFFFGEKLLAYTDHGAKNLRIVEIDVDDPSEGKWKDVVPESDRAIQQFATVDGRIVVARADRFSVKVQTYSLDGHLSNDVECGPYQTITFHPQLYSTQEMFFGCTSLCEPAIIHRYRFHEEKQWQTWDQAVLPFDPGSIGFEEVEYESKDGVRIPLFLAARKELLHTGPLPAFLTGYGGFGNCVTPRFSILSTFLLEQGVLLATPALRGGSELGEQWHQAAKGRRRQNAFDDFLAAAEWLLETGRAAPGRIAIGGASNAGLLIGAAITQRPELFRAAICLGPLLDMVRYHLFDFARGWADEYGSADDADDFRYLLSYSPYHCVRRHVHYPAVLLVSGDADTRCNPMHTRKMAARLQAATSSQPILLDYRLGWGHTPVQPLPAKIEALTDRLSFLCHELGISVLPAKES